jgi:uncharacterized protein
LRYLRKRRLLYNLVVLWSEFGITASEIWAEMAPAETRYEQRFGYAIEPYLSSADAIATFPTTATAVGVRRIRGKLECCAPFGLDDLFGLIVRPNKGQITRAIYEAKVDRWRSIWPRLTFVPWREMVPPVR